MRLFIAFPIDSILKNNISKMTDSLKKERKATWVQPVNYHITIQFLGEINPEMVPVIDRNLIEINKGLTSFLCQFQSVTFFPTIQRPKTLVVSIKKNEVMNQIASVIHGKMAQIDLLNQTPFAPHLTIARFKTNYGVGEPLQKPIHVNQITKISKFELIQSVLRNEGPLYKDLKSYSLEEEN
jgi:2'-5' RNA ligase